MRFSPFNQNNKNIILSSQQQPQPQQNPTVSARHQQQLRKSGTPSSSSMTATLKTVKSNETLTHSGSDTDDDERDFFDEEDVSDLPLSKEERYVLRYAITYGIHNFKDI
jgi:hypothetical protein